MRSPVGAVTYLMFVRKVYKCWCLNMLGVRLGDGSNAPSLGGGDQNIDGRVVPLPSTAAHDPIAVRKPLWTRRNSLNATMKTYKMTGINI